MLIRLSPTPLCIVGHGDVALGAPRPKRYDWRNERHPIIAENVLALVSGLPAPKRYSRLILMLQAYFDDSTERGEALIFSGYLQTVDKWLDFSQEWADLLTLSPRMRPFKMSAIRPARMERARAHYRVIERMSLIGIGCAIPIKPLRAVVKDMNLPPAQANPYFLAWRTVITAALERARMSGSTDPIEFIFDDQSEKTKIIEGWDYYYRSAPASVRKRIRGVPAFKNDEDVVALQAADMLAWWARKQYLKDKTKMGSLFPETWLNGKEPNLYFVNLPEEGMRKQFTKDIEAASGQTDFKIRASWTFRGQPS